MNVILDAREMSDRDVTERYLLQKLDLPAYFGGNMDALYDCLTEMSDTVILIENKKEGSEYFHRVLRVIRAATRDNAELSVKIR